MNRKRAVHRIILVSLLVLSGWQFGQAGWIQGKAVVAQYLLENAWQQVRHGRAQVKPWPWADTWPVARLTVPALGVDQIVLAGDSGRTLAFGPGYALASVWPGKPGTTLISGHRDTHFRFLKDLKQGDIIRLQTPTRDLQYVVKDVAIVDARKFRLPGTIGRTRRLFLSTCYPFDAIQAGGVLRYLVETHAI